MRPSKYTNVIGRPSIWPIRECADVSLGDGLDGRSEVLLGKFLRECPSPGASEVGVVVRAALCLTPPRELERRAWFQIVKGLNSIRFQIIKGLNSIRFQIGLKCAFQMVFNLCGPLPRGTDRHQVRRLSLENHSWQSRLFTPRIKPQLSSVSSSTTSKKATCFPRSCFELSETVSHVFTTLSQAAFLNSAFRVSHSNIWVNSEETVLSIWAI